MIDKDAVVTAMAAGSSMRQIAQRHKCSIHDVQSVLNRAAMEMAMPANRATALAIEVARLETLEVFFTRHALSNADIAAGTLVAKLSQRRAALLGLDAPVQLDLTVAVEPYRETSTARLHRILSELRGEPVTIEGNQTEPGGSEPVT
jgi:hypothetical protein